MIQSEQELLGKFFLIFVTFKLLIHITHLLTISFFSFSPLHRILQWISLLEIHLSSSSQTTAL